MDLIIDLKALLHFSYIMKTNIIVGTLDLHPQLVRRFNLKLIQI